MTKTKKKITLWQLKRMLRGTNYIRITAYILMAAFPVWTYMVLAGEKPHDQPAAAILIWLFIILFSLFISGFRIRRAKGTIRQLRSWDELENVLAEINGDTYLIPHYPHISEPSKGNLLGNRFIFVFTDGRIIRYYQIAAVSVYRGSDQHQLIISDTTGRRFPLVETLPEDGKIIDDCLEQIHLKYLGCPQTLHASETCTCI